MLTTLIPNHDGLVTTYARPGGSDYAFGDLANPLETLDGVARRIETSLYGNRRHQIDVTGLSDSREVLHGLVTPRTAGRDSFNLAPAHPTFLVETPWMLRAVMPTVLAIPTYSVTTEAVHDMVAITVPGATWTTDQWAGFMLGGSGLFEGGAIDRNSGDTLWVAYAGPLTGPLAIWDYGASLEYGTSDPLSSFQPALDLHSYGMSLVQGIRFSTLGTGAAVRVEARGGGFLYLSNCRFDGGLQLRGPGSVIMDSCYVNGLLGFDNGVEVSMRRSAVYDALAVSHGANVYYLNNRIRASGPVGHGGTGSFVGTFEVQECEILDGTGNGVEYTGGPRSSVRDTVISGCNGDAVFATNPGKLFLSDVQGSGNGGYGLQALDGVQVKAVGGTGVSGDLGEVKAGGLLVDTWANLPLIDACGGDPQLVRVDS